MSSINQKVLNWADMSPIESREQPLKQAKLSFDQRYPRIKNPLKLNDGQRLDLTPRLGLTTVGEHEVDLALTRTPSDTDHVKVSAVVTDIIRHWRDENTENSDEAAARKLLDGSASLAVIDGKAAAARLALEQAEAEEREFERSYDEFKTIPAKVEQLSGRAASLRAQRKELAETDFDKKISQLLELEYSPKVGVTIHGSVPALLMIKQTLPLRLQVIDSLTARIDEELTKLEADNKRLSKELDLSAHTL
jgi:hypothetical protein